jgi:hypothetical protein
MPHTMHEAAGRVIATVRFAMVLLEAAKLADASAIGAPQMDYKRLFIHSCHCLAVD